MLVSVLFINQACDKKE